MQNIRFFILLILWKISSSVDLGRVDASFYSHYSQVDSEIRVIIRDRYSCMGQKDKSENYLYLIGILDTI